MDFAYDVLKPVINLFVLLCSVECTVAGITFTVGSVFAWVAVAGLVIWFLRGLAG